MQIPLKIKYQDAPFSLILILPEEQDILQRKVKPMINISFESESDLTKMGQLLKERKINYQHSGNPLEPLLIGSEGLGAALKFIQENWVEDDVENPNKTSFTNFIKYGSEDYILKWKDEFDNLKFLESLARLDEHRLISFNIELFVEQLAEFSNNNGQTNSLSEFSSKLFELNLFSKNLDSNADSAILADAIGKGDFDLFQSSFYSQLSKYDKNHPYGKFLRSEGEMSYKFLCLKNRRPYRLEYYKDFVNAWNLGRIEYVPNSDGIFQNIFSVNIDFAKIYLIYIMFSRPSADETFLGCPEAQLMLANINKYFPKMVPAEQSTFFTTSTHDRALAYYEKAAASGSLFAKQELGIIYSREKKYAKAVPLLYAALVSNLFATRETSAMKELLKLVDQGNPLALSALQNFINLRIDQAKKALTKFKEQDFDKNDVVKEIHSDVSSTISMKLPEGLPAFSIFALRQVHYLGNYAKTLKDNSKTGYSVARLALNKYITDFLKPSTNAIASEENESGLAKLEAIYSKEVAEDSKNSELKEKILQLSHDLIADLQQFICFGREEKLIKLILLTILQKTIQVSNATDLPQKIIDILSSPVNYSAFFLNADIPRKLKEQLFALDKTSPSWNTILTGPFSDKITKVLQEITKHTSAELSPYIKKEHSAEEVAPTHFLNKKAMLVFSLTILQNYLELNEQEISGEAMPEEMDEPYIANLVFIPNLLRAINDPTIQNIHQLQICFSVFISIPLTKENVEYAREYYLRQGVTKYITSRMHYLDGMIRFFDYKNNLPKEDYEDDLGSFLSNLADNLKETNFPEDDNKSDPPSTADKPDVGSSSRTAADDTANRFNTEVASDSEDEEAEEGANKAADTSDDDDLPPFLKELAQKLGRDRINRILKDFSDEKNEEEEDSTNEEENVTRSRFGMDMFVGDEDSEIDFGSDFSETTGVINYLFSLIRSNPTLTPEIDDTLFSHIIRNLPIDYQKYLPSEIKHFIESAIGKTIKDLVTPSNQEPEVPISLGQSSSP